MKQYINTLQRDIDITHTESVSYGENSCLSKQRNEENYGKKLDEPVKDKILRWHSSCHDISHLISVGEVELAQQFLSQMDKEMHDAC